MKKILLGTSALVGAVAFASVAQAGADISMSGSLEYRFVAYDNDTSANSGHGVDLHTNNSGSELAWTATYAADNGLTYGANLQIRYTSMSIDESHIFFKGNWGTVKVGDEDGALESKAVGGFSVLAATGGHQGDGGSRDSNGSTAQGMTSSGVSSADASKISYTTPSFSGFSAMVSYTPDATTFTSGAADGTWQNMGEIGVGYSGDFSGVSVGLGAGYRAASSTNTGTEDVQTLMVGGKVGFAGFSVGLGYRDFGDSGCAKATTCDAGNAWDVGVSYNYGPGSISVGYMDSEATTAGTTPDDGAEVWSVGVDYTVAEGLKTYAEYISGEYTDGSKTDTAATNAADQIFRTNDASSFIIGTKVSF